MQEHKEWLKFAFVDLKTAKIILDSGEDLVVGSILYHCQQSAEKALKAYLVFKEQPISKIHDLVKLVRTCGELDPDFLTLLFFAAELAPFATKVRYPDSMFFMPDISVARHAVQLAEIFFNFVEDKI